MMRINLNKQYNGGFLPNTILLTLRYYHRETRLNAMMKRFAFLQPLFPPKRFGIFLSCLGDAQGGLDMLKFLFKELESDRRE